MTLRLRWRKLVSGIMLTCTGACAFIAVSLLFFILGYLVYHGGRALYWGFFTKLPPPGGEAGGGMANAPVGGAQLLLPASLGGGRLGVFGGVVVAGFGGRGVGGGGWVG